MIQTDPVLFRRLPHALKDWPSWVLWKYEQRAEKWTKVPYQTNGQRASSTEPATWATLEAVQQAKWRQMGTYHGVGFVFSAADPFVGIDLDHCRGEWWAAELLDRFATYVEITPSWTGYHLIGMGALPEGKGRRKGAIEVYDRGRFFTMTGRQSAGSTTEPQPIQPALDALLADIAPPTPVRTPAPNWTPSLDVEQVLRRGLLAKNGDKVRRLYAGDNSMHGDDDSAADLALLECLTLYTRDAGTLDAIMRASGRMRPKWDEPRGQTTYGGLTIDAALARAGAFYGGRDVAPSRRGARGD